MLFQIARRYFNLKPFNYVVIYRFVPDFTEVKTGRNGLWERISILSHAFQMEFQTLFHHAPHFTQGLTR